MITVIIVIALFFRLYRLEELMVFSGETNNLFYYIESYLAGEKPRLLGLEAAQYVHHLFHLPWYLWMMIPIFFAGGGNPLVFAVFQAAIGAFGSYLMWRVGLMLGSKKIGWLAAFGYAASFHFSTVERFVSPVSLVPFGVIAIIYLGLRARLRQKRFDYFLLGLWAGIAVSFHYALLSGVLFVLGWVFWRQKRFFWLSLGGVLLVFLPLLLFDLRHGFFNLTGLWYVGKSLFDNTRPYGSSHFIYQLYPVLTIAAAWLVASFPRKVIWVLVVVFFVSQLAMLKNYEIHPNFSDREKVVSQILSNWSNGIRVYFKNESSFDYAYLLRYTAKRHSLDPRNIEIYEPWQPENDAGIVVEGNGTLVYSRE
jgi:hypothetical protein